MLCLFNDTYLITAQDQCSTAQYTRFTNKIYIISYMLYNFWVKQFQNWSVSQYITIITPIHNTHHKYVTNFQPWQQPKQPKQPTLSHLAEMLVLKRTSISFSLTAVTIPLKLRPPRVKEIQAPGASTPGAGAGGSKLRSAVLVATLTKKELKKWWQQMNIWKSWWKMNMMLKLWWNVNLTFQLRMSWRKRFWHVLAGFAGFPRRGSWGSWRMKYDESTELLGFNCLKMFKKTHTLAARDPDLHWDLPNWCQGPGKGQQFPHPPASKDKIVGAKCHYISPPQHQTHSWTPMAPISQTCLQNVAYRSCRNNM